ncbi:MAG: hypothetical protein HY547_04505 [Elusimicrobia bacterium]|nr:hypothetical protein [Elusimicrobiota bacterium]
MRQNFTLRFIFLFMAALPAFAGNEAALKESADKVFDAGSKAVVTIRCGPGVCITSEDRIIETRWMPPHHEPRDRGRSGIGTDHDFRGSVELVGPKRVDLHEVTKNYEIYNRKEFVNARGWRSSLAGFGVGALLGGALGLAIGFGLLALAPAFTFGVGGALVGDSLGVAAAQDKPDQFSKTVRYTRETDSLF